jgi:hypothetical protein
MENKVRDVSLTCPICKKKNTITVPEKVLAQKKFGSIKIQIPPGAVCPDHQFIVFLDPKGLVRGYEKIDVFMGDSQTDPKENGEEAKISVNNLVKEFGLYGVLSLLHAKLFNYRAYVLREDISKYDIQQLNNFLNDITENNYFSPPDLKFFKREDYEVLEIEENKVLSIDENNNIIHTPWNEKLKFEENSIKDAIDIINPNEQKIIIKQNVNSFLRKVKYSIRILKDVKKINKLDLRERLSNDLDIPRIPINQIEMIKKFISRNLSEEMGAKIIKRTEDFLGSL